MHSGRAEIPGAWQVWVDRAASDLRGASYADSSATNVGAATDVGVATDAGVSTSVSGATTTVSGAATAVGVGTVVATADAVGTAGFIHHLCCANSLRLQMVFNFP